MTEQNEVPFARPDCLYINGEWVKPSTDAVFEVISPGTEEIYVRVAEAREADMDRAIAAARQAFDSGPWPRMSHAERAGFLTRMGVMLTDRAPDVARVWPNESGITYASAKIRSPGMGGIYSYYASLATSFAFEEERKPLGGGDAGILLREPVGVVAAIIPWNAPIVLMAYKIAPALLAGCTVIVKSAPEAPGMAYIMAEIADAIGLPPGVLNVVTADREISERLVVSPLVDKVSFTGSTAAGRRIASLCGERIARYTLELGGKSAALIMDDYDIEMAARSIVGPACANAGQACSALTRIVVTRNRHDRLVEALAEQFKAIRVGDPFDPDNQMGPVAMRRQRDKIERLMEAGRQEGAKVAAGGGRPAHLNRGFFIEPTVFGNVDNHSTIAREEIFGPVVCVIPADSEAHAIEIANDTIYGLNNSVFTNDADRAYQVARQLRSGTVGHNMWRSDFSIGFGEFKQSGIGREGGTEGLLPYLENKTIVLEGRPAHLGA